EWAARSQQRAEEAGKHGRFEDEIASVQVPQPAGDAIAFARDENPRPGATPASLAAFEPAFEHGGSVTTGNVSVPGDGAAIVLVTSSERCRELGLEPLARIAGYANSGVAPELMGISPVPATQACLRHAGWRVADLD